MSSYIITGSADNKELAKCEYISNQAKLSFKIIIKPPNQWEDHINKVCRVYGFFIKENPIIYRNDGKLIGSSQNFYEFIEQNFNINTQEYDDSQRNEKINMEICENKLKDEDKLNKGYQTLQEKILQKFDNCSYNSNRYIIDQGLQFQMMDEFQIKVDIPFLIERTQDQNQNQEPIWNPEESVKLEQTLPEVPQVSEQMVIDEQEQCSQNRKPSYAKEPTKEIVIRKFRDQYIQSIMPQEIIITTIDKELIIEKLGQKYYLAKHPQALIKGHCLIFKSNSQSNQKQSHNKCLKNKYLYNTSQLQMFRNNYSNIKNAQNIYEKTQINIYEPFNSDLFNKIKQVFNNQSGYIFYQILPSGAKNYFSNQSNLYHFVPDNMIQNKQLELFQQNLISFKFTPLKDKIVTKIEIQREVKDDPIVEPKVESKVDFKLDPKQEVKQEVKPEPQEIEYEEKIDLVYGKERIFYKNKNYSFIHLIHKIQDGERTNKMIKDMIICLRDKFNFDAQKSGYNIIMTKEFIFISPLDKAYYKYDTIEVYNSIFAFMGLIHIPKFIKLKPYEEIFYPTLQTINPIQDLFQNSQN